MIKRALCFVCLLYPLYGHSHEDDILSIDEDWQIGVINERPDEPDVAYKDDNSWIQLVNDLDHCKGNYETGLVACDFAAGKSVGKTFHRVCERAAFQELVACVKKAFRDYRRREK